MKKKINIDGYELIVSDDGRVWSPEKTIYRSDGIIRHEPEQLLTQFSSKRGGYLLVNRSINKKHKSFKVHRLVATAFIPNPNNLPMINHKDGNKQNNHVSNLEWCTSSENTTHAYQNKLHSLNKPIMCIETGAQYYSIGEASRQLNINIPSIWKVLHKKLNHVHGFHFKFI